MNEKLVALWIATMTLTVAAAPLEWFGEKDAAARGVTEKSYNPPRFDAALESVVYDRVPPPHLLNTWRVMGSKVYRRLGADPLLTADEVRRRAGFAARRAGVDGVIVPDALPDGWSGGLAEAKRDVAACDALAKLADACLAKPEPVRTEGRRAQALLAGYRLEADCDLHRLEVLALVRRLELLLGREPSEPDLPPAVRPPVRTPAPTGDFKSVRFDFASAANDLGGALGGVKIRACAFDRYMPGVFEFEFPNDSDGCWTFTLWIAGREKGDCPAYRIRYRRPESDAAKTVPRPAGIYYSLERRFPAEPTLEVEYTRTLSPSYPPLHPELPRYPPAGGMLVTLYWNDFYGFWPGTDAQRRDAWYVEVTRPDGKVFRAKLQWAASQTKRNAEKKMLAIGDNLSYHRLWTGYLDRTTGRPNDREHNVTALAAWTMAAKETGWNAPETTPESFSMFAPASDALFNAVRVRPFYERNAPFEKLFACEADHPKSRPRILSEGEIPRLKAYGAMGNFLFFDLHVDEMRRAYLLDRFAGRKPAAAPPPKKKAVESAPVADDGEDGAVSLEEEF